jgi:hypothetical protein
MRKWYDYLYVDPETIHLHVDILHEDAAGSLV